MTLLIVALIGVIISLGFILLAMHNRNTERNNLLREILASLRDTNLRVREIELNITEGEEAEVAEEVSEEEDTEAPPMDPILSEYDSLLRRVSRGVTDAANNSIASRLTSMLPGMWRTTSYTITRGPAPQNNTQERRGKHQDYSEIDL